MSEIPLPPTYDRICIQRGHRYEGQDAKLVRFRGNNIIVEFKDEHQEEFHRSSMVTKGGPRARRAARLAKSKMSEETLAGKIKDLIIKRGGMLKHDIIHFFKDRALRVEVEFCIQKCKDDYGLTTDPRKADPRKGGNGTFYCFPEE